MVEDDTLHDGVIGLSFAEGHSQLIAGESPGELTSLVVHAILLDVQLDVFLMGCVATAGLPDNIEVLPDHSAAHLDVEDSLAWVPEVHLDKVGATSANLRMRVALPSLVGRE